MGSCVSRSPASASSAGSSGRRLATAKVVGIDGSMTQYTAPVTAREALGDDERRGAASVFLCSSDELRLDEPPRPLADEETLQPGWLYFVLPVSMLRLTLSRHEMATLAVRASSALAVASGVASPPRRKTSGRVAGNKGKQRKTARVASLVFAIDEDTELVDGGELKAANAGSGKTAGKRAGYGSRGARPLRRAAGVQRLSAISETDEF